MRVLSALSGNRFGTQAASHGADARAPSVLPPWKDAIPLWATESWIWVRLQPTGSPQHVYSSETQSAQTLPILEQGALQAHGMIVLDCLVGRAIQPGLWSRLEAMLSPGGLLIVCGPSRRYLSRYASRGERRLGRSERHVIELQDEGSWRLCPDNRSMRSWLDSHLNPPSGLRTWLRQIGARWLAPPGQRIYCLLLWKEADA